MLQVDLCIVYGGEALGSQHRRPAPGWSEPGQQSVVGGHTVTRSPAVACCVLNVKVLVDTLNQEKGPSRGILHDCDNFADY